MDFIGDYNYLCINYLNKGSHAKAKVGTRPQSDLFLMNNEL